MIFIAALIAILSASYLLAGIAVDALAGPGRIVWLAVPLAVVGSLMVSCLAVFVLFYTPLATSEPFDPVFGSWVVTSWAGILGIPLSIAIAVRVVFDEEDQP